MKNTILVLFLSLALLGCVTEQTAQKSQATKAIKPIDYTKWEKYGAVFEYDNVKIKAFFDLYNGFETTFKVSQKMKILSREGIKYATYHAEQYAGELAKFQIRVIAEDGTKKQINIAKVKKQFTETGRIVIPQVEIGNEIFIDYTYRDKKPFHAFESVLNKNIPVLHSKTTFLHTFNYKFRYKTYSTTSEIKKITKNSRTGFEITEENIRPVLGSKNQQQERFLYEYRYQNHARVAIGLKSFKVQGKKYGDSNWQELANSFEERFFDPSLFSSQDRIVQILKTLNVSNLSSFDKADTILQYVQNNISVIPTSYLNSFSLDVDKVLEQKVGTHFEISAVLSIMLQEAGFTTKHYLTRSVLQGGFDPDFPTWRMMQIPIITAEIDGKEYVAFPFLKDCELGEYLPEISHQYALNLESGEPVALPHSTHSGISLTSTVNLSLDKASEPQFWDFTFGDQAAIVTRVLLGESSKSDRKDLATNLLTTFSDEHTVVTAEYIGNFRGKNAELLVKFKNPNIVINHPEGKYVSLSPFFRSYFNELQEEDVEEFTNEFDATTNEEVRLKNYSTNKTEIDITCPEINNSLFESSCSESQDGSDYVIRRIVTVKKTTITPNQLAQIKTDIEALNTMRSSYVIMSN